MITLPTLQPTLAWHQQLSWRRYVEQLFRLVSRRRDFRLELQRGRLIAGVIPEQRRVLLNPDLIPVPAMGVRFDPQTPHGQRTQLLRAIMAHEAGHVVFSASKPAGELGWLWNALEDERMERLVMRRFPELCRDFDFLGDAMLLKGEPEATDFMNACLRWRWGHDRPDIPFEVQAQDQEAWEQARPLVEEAWETTRDGVELLAARILALRPAPPAGEPPKSRPELNADGGGMSEAQPEEQKQAQGTGEPDVDEATEAASTDGGEETPEQEEHQARDEAGAGTGKSPGVEKDTPEEPEDTSGPSGRTTPTSDGEDQGQPQQGRGEAPLPAPPPPAPGEDPSQGASDHAGPPRDLSRRESAQEMLDRIEVHARHLTRILAPPIRPAHATPHRSKGRFRYDRYTQGAEKYFGRKVGEDRPAPFLLRLVVDMSSSMAGGRLNAAQEAALMLARAANLAGSRLQVVSFDYNAYETVPLDMPWAESVDAIAGLEARGGTLLSSALRLVLAGERRPEEREVIAIICDGELTTYDRLVCGLLLGEQQREHRTIVPLLIGEGIQGQAIWEALFGTAVPVHDTENIARTLFQSLTRLRQKLEPRLGLAP